MNVRIMVLAAALGGCANNNHLREAQDTFNQTAALENKYRIDPGSVQQPMAIESGYTAVIVSLEKLEKDTDAVRSLRGDKLYGNALALKAMAYWRLHSYDKANAAAREAEREGLDPVSRDKAFIDALPGLIKNDQAYARLWGPPPSGAPLTNEQKLKDIADLIDSAQRDLEAAENGLPEQHPMRRYLVIAGLSAVKNLSDACNKLPAGDKLRTDCYDDKRIDCRARKLVRRAQDLGLDQKLLLFVGEGTIRDPDVFNDARSPLPANCK